MSDKKKIINTRAKSRKTMLTEREEDLDTEKTPIKKSKIVDILINDVSPDSAPGESPSINRQDDIELSEQNQSNSHESQAINTITDQEHFTHDKVHHEEYADGERHKR